MLVYLEDAKTLLDLLKLTEDTKKEAIKIWKKAKLLQGSKSCRNCNYYYQAMEYDCDNDYRAIGPPECKHHKAKIFERYSSRFGTTYKERDPRKNNPYGFCSKFKIKEIIS